MATTEVATPSMPSAVAPSFEMAGASKAPQGTYLTCMSCHLLFGNTKDQRLHYKNDLHRFNLKRKVAKLPPVTQQVFEEKVLGILSLHTIRSIVIFTITFFAVFCWKNI